MTTSDTLETSAATISPAPEADTLALDRQLCFALYSCSLAMSRRYTPLLKPLGVTYPQYLVLLDLWQYRIATVSALGERLHLDSGTLTPLLKRLEQRALLKRQRDASDERRVLVSLTPAGLALRGLALGIPQTLAATTLCKAEEISALTQRLQTLREQLLQAQP